SRTGCASWVFLPPAPQKQSSAGGKKTHDAQPVLECRAGQELASSILFGNKRRTPDAANRDVFHGARTPEPAFNGRKVNYL
ncbi:MAG TPA: hypothetical protein VFC11_02635, partial [Methylocella sp.]|nr:hypothetical protein [Methylocella sp.]